MKFNRRGIEQSLVEHAAATKPCMVRIKHFFPLAAQRYSDSVNITDRRGEIAYHDHYILLVIRLTLIDHHAILAVAIIYPLKSLVIKGVLIQGFFPLVQLVQFHYYLPHSAVRIVIQ